MRRGECFNELHTRRGKHGRQVLQHRQNLLVRLVLERGKILRHVAHKVNVILLMWST